MRKKREAAHGFPEHGCDTWGRHLEAVGAHGIPLSAGRRPGQPCSVLHGIKQEHGASPPSQPGQRRSQPRHVQTLALQMFWTTTPTVLCHWQFKPRVVVRNIRRAEVPLAGLEGGGQRFDARMHERWIAWDGCWGQKRVQHFHACSWVPQLFPNTVENELH